MVAPVRWCWCSRPLASVRNSRGAPPGCWGEARGAGGIPKNDGVAVVRAWQAAWRRWPVGVDACSLFSGGPRHGVGWLQSSGSVDTYSLADDPRCHLVHAYIVAVPFVALCEVAVHILEQVRYMWVECGPFNCLPVLDLGGAVFDQEAGGLGCGAAVLGEHREGNGSLLGVPRSLVESPFRPSAGAPRHCGPVLRRGPFEECVRPPIFIRGSVGRWYVVVARQ